MIYFYFFLFIVLRFSMMADCEYKEDVLKLMNSLVNILAIVKVYKSIRTTLCS